jgi:hypothetical protein
MTDEQAIEHVRAILNADVAAMVAVFADEAHKIDQAAVGNYGNAGHVIDHQRHAAAFLPNAFREIKTNLGTALDKTELDWDAAVQSKIDGLFDEMARNLLAATNAPFDRFAGGGRAQLAEKSKSELGEQFEIQKKGGQSNVALYVADRRRKAVLNLLSDLESTLVTAGAAEAALKALRDSRTEVTANKDPGKLKQVLETLSTSIQGVVAAHDLGVRLTEMVTWFST